MDKTLLPNGRHWGLTISHQIHRTGPFTTGHPKIIWHTTEGSGMGGAVSTLNQNGDQPHFVIDPHVGRVLQMIRLDEYARALQHPSGTPETNRAHCIQVEVVGFASSSHLWPLSYYNHLAALACLIEHRVDVPRTAPNAFRMKGATRVAPDAFPTHTGHYGHEHVPHNDHTDPGALNTTRLFGRMRALTAHYA